MDENSQRSTETSSFGTPGRISHDASKFYGSRLYEGLQGESEVPYVENPPPAEKLNRVYLKSSERMDELPDNSVHLMVTSPPYNASKEYDQDLSLEEYLDLLGSVWAETYRVLVPGGRAASTSLTWGVSPTSPCMLSSSSRCWRLAS